MGYRERAAGSGELREAAIAGTSGSMSRRLVLALALLGACSEGEVAVRVCADTADAAFIHQGQPYDLMTDPDHCGCFGQTCPEVAGGHALRVCRAGRCDWRCEDGYGDCDGDAGNGCETSLGTDPDRCGACDVSCRRANTTATCVNGSCQRQCHAGFGDCDGDASNGCEAPLLSSVSHCGACGVSCEAANASVSCVSGRCQRACLAGYEDCDTDAANGCEADLRRSTAHCGRCAAACPARLNAAVTCAAGSCRSVCYAGSGDCDGDATNGCESTLAAGEAVCPPCATPCYRTVPQPRPTFIDACSLPGRQTLLSAADDQSARVQVPFQFRYWSTMLAAGTPINVSTNGWINAQLPPSTLSSLSGTIPGAAQPNAVIAPYWSDVVTRGGMCLATVGAAPARRWIVMWNDVYHYGSAVADGGATQHLTFEVVLYEGSHAIEFAYQRMDGAGPVTVGIENYAGDVGVSGCPGTTNTRCVPAANSAVRFELNR